MLKTQLFEFEAILATKLGNANYSSINTKATQSQWIGKFSQHILKLTKNSRHSNICRLGLLFGRFSLN